MSNSRVALAAMRKMCRDAGLNGLIVAGEDRNDARAALAKFRVAGLDASWSYGMRNVADLRLRREWDLLPEEIGLGPYEDSYERWLQSCKDQLDGKKEWRPNAKSPQTLRP